MSYTISIDIGGTTFSFIIFKSNNAIYKSNTYSIKKYDNYKEFLNFLIKQIKMQTKNEIINLIGIACPGPLNTNTGEILNTPNLTILQYVNIKNYFEKNIKCDKVLIENDANVYALGSYYSLKNKCKNDVLLGITLGTGIGFGIIINGCLFKGSYGMAGEYELSPLTNNLTWADLIGYKFFKNKSNKYFNENKTPKQIYELAEENNIDALSIWNQYGTNIGLCLSHVIGIINPNYISIGGGISKANKFFHNKIIKTLEDKCLTYRKESINIFYDNNDISNIYLGWLI